MDKIEKLVYDIYGTSIIPVGQITDEQMTDMCVKIYQIWKSLQEIKKEKDDLLNDLIEADAELHYAIELLSKFMHLSPEEVDHILSNKL